MSSQYASFINQHGQSLLAGVDELGLTHEAALSAIAIARKERIPILGGDVYVRDGDAARPAYANWHTDRRSGESVEDYAERTWSESEQYVSDYPGNEMNEILFVLVTAE